MPKVITEDIAGHYQEHLSLLVDEKWLSKRQISIRTGVAREWLGQFVNGDRTNVTTDWLELVFGEAQTMLREVIEEGMQEHGLTLRQIASAVKVDYYLLDGFMNGGGLSDELSRFVPSIYRYFEKLKQDRAIGS